MISLLDFRAILYTTEGIVGLKMFDLLAYHLKNYI